MKHLIIYAHPEATSLNASMKNYLVQHLSADAQVRVRDLYALSFNPVMTAADLAGQQAGRIAPDVAIEQQEIEWADCLTFIYPLWWAGMPAIMKGYIDRVFSYGFAYCYEQGQQRGLLDKPVVIINSQGKSSAEYQASGMDKALAMTSDHGIFHYCGLQVKAHVYLERAQRVTDEQVQRWQAQLGDVFRHI